MGIFVKYNAFENAIYLSLFLDIELKIFLFKYLTKQKLCQTS